MKFNEENYIQNGLLLCTKFFDELHEAIEGAENQDEHIWVNKTYLAFSYTLFTSLLAYAPEDVILGFKKGFEKTLQECIEKKIKGNKNENGK